MMLRRWLLLLALLPLVVLAQGCSTYSYFDVDLKLGDGFNTVVQTGNITKCHVFVTGAATDDFLIGNNICLNSDKLASTKDLGKIRYSTFADSGDVTFTLRLFHLMETDACELGHADTKLTVSSGNTVAGMITVPLSGPGCPQ